METNLVIFLAINKWNQLTMARSSSVNNLVLCLHQVYAQLLLINHHITLPWKFLQLFMKKLKNNKSRKQLLRKFRDRKYTYDEISISLESLYFQNGINFIDKDDGKTQWTTIYEVIYDLYLEEGNIFTKYFVQKCKRNANIP